MPFRHGRTDDGVRIDSFVKELLPEPEAGLILTDDDGDYRRLRLADIEASSREALHHKMRVVPRAVRRAPAHAP